MELPRQKVLIFTKLFFNVYIIGVSRYNEEPVEVILKADLNDMKSKYDWYRMNTKPVHTSQKVWVEDGTSDRQAEQ